MPSLLVSMNRAVTDDVQDQALLCLSECISMQAAHSEGSAADNVRRGEAEGVL
jgi:hypothetical protein